MQYENIFVTLVLHYLTGFFYPELCSIVCTIYNMSGRVVSDIQTRAEGESLYIRYNTDANVVNDLKNDSSYEFIGEVILKINVV
jgi:hypothetical protein